MNLGFLLTKENLFTTSFSKIDSSKLLGAIDEGAETLEDYE